MRVWHMEGLRRRLSGTPTSTPVVSAATAGQLRARSPALGKQQALDLLHITVRFLPNTRILSAAGEARTNNMMNWPPLDLHQPSNRDQTHECLLCALMTLSVENCQRNS